MDWDDPIQRLDLLERVGADLYNAAFEAYRKSIVMFTINGHDIIPVNTRFGRLFSVAGTDRAFADLADAKAFAAQHKGTKP